MDDVQLKKYFEFDEADLFANRAGVLTDKQRTSVVEAAKFVHKVFRIAGLVIMGVGVLPSLILWFVDAPWLFLVVWSLVWVPLGIFFGIKVFRLGAPDEKGPVLKKVEGRVNLVKEESYNSSTKQTVHEYELHLGGETFDVDSELADIMMQGDAYIIYYMEETKQIMSVERLA